MDRSRIAALAAVVALVGLASSVEAVGPNTCTAGKIACANSFSASVFKCYTKVFKVGFTSANADRAEECIRKARRKFGTAESPKPACWDKVEQKQVAAKPETVCEPGGDEFDVDDLVKDFTLDIVSNEVAPSGPRSAGTSCGAGKVACVGAFFKKILGCEAKGAKEGVAADPACIAKAVAKFDGGGVPGKGCFAKLEGKEKLGKPKTYCDAEGNTAVTGGKTQAFVDDLLGMIGL